MKLWLYHKNDGAQVFDLDVSDQAQLHTDGWRDTPAHPDFTATPEPKAPLQAIADGITTKKPTLRRKKA